MGALIPFEGGFVLGSSFTSSPFFLDFETGTVEPRFNDMPRDIVIAEFPV